MRTTAVGHVELPNTHTDWASLGHEELHMYTWPARKKQHLSGSRHGIQLWHVETAEYPYGIGPELHSLYPNGWVKKADTLAVLRRGAAGQDISEIPIRNGTSSVAKVWVHPLRAAPLLVASLVFCKTAGHT